MGQHNLNNYFQKSYSRFYNQHYKGNTFIQLDYYNIHQDIIHSNSHLFLIYKIYWHKLNMLLCHLSMMNNLSNILHNHHFAYNSQLNKKPNIPHLQHFIYLKPFLHHMINNLNLYHQHMSSRQNYKHHKFLQMYFQNVHHHKLINIHQFKTYNKMILSMFHK